MRRRMRAGLVVVSIMGRILERAVTSASRSYPMMRPWWRESGRQAVFCDGLADLAENGVEVGRGFLGRFHSFGDGSQFDAHQAQTTDGTLPAFGGEHANHRHAVAPEQLRSVLD